MAKVKIQGHASGSGVLTVTAPNTSTDRTITLPDATATIATTTDVAARLPSITDGGNATAITINSSENVGIGTANPAKPLHIMKTAGANTIENLLLLDCNVDSAASGKGGSIVFQDIAAYPNTAEISAARVGGGSSSEVKIKLRNADMLVLNSDGRGLSQFTAKAWVNFNGTSTVAIRDSHNVGSITDSGTGNYIVNLSVAVANVNGVAAVGGDGYNCVTTHNSTSAISLQNLAANLSNEDKAILHMVLFGD